MSNYKIVEVKGRKDLMKFIKFPDRLYKDCPQYVPALHSDQVKSLTKVSSLSYCSRKMWMVMDGDKVAGRICGMINPRYNERYSTKRARFGWFDTIEDFEVAELLIKTAENWARENGMDEIHGPLYYNTLGKQGMLVEGYENTPPFNCLYNYPYYNDFITRLGYAKECDWIQYKLDPEQPLPDKIVRIGHLMKERYNLHEISIDKLKKDKTMVRRFFDVYNDSFAASVYNFIPFTDEEKEEEASEIISFVSDKYSCVLVDEEGEIAGFSIGIPSISKALQKAKGKLFPFGWFHLLRGLASNTTVDLMLNGATPKYQNTGISAVYHVSMSEKYHLNGAKLAITNPQIESNGAVNVWAKYEHELFMRRRCYLKSL